MYRARLHPRGAPQEPSAHCFRCWFVRTCSSAVFAFVDHPRAQLSSPVPEPPSSPPLLLLTRLRVPLPRLTSLRMEEPEAEPTSSFTSPLRSSTARRPIGVEPTRRLERARSRASLVLVSHSDCVDGSKMLTTRTNLRRPLRGSYQCRPRCRLLKRHHLVCRADDRAQVGVAGSSVKKYRAREGPIAGSGIEKACAGRIDGQQRVIKYFACSPYCLQA